MDGYAVRAADSNATFNDNAAPLDMIGMSAAGHRFAGELGPGQTVRIFTGAPVPDGADSVLIQEEADIDGNGAVRATAALATGANVRGAGLDFKVGDPLLAAGAVLGFGELALAAAAGAASLNVRRKPKIAMLATGDELVQPGGSPGPDQIYSSNAAAVGAYLASAGAETLDLGIALDDKGSISAAVDRARQADADLLLTFGGVSVGDHDLVQATLRELGMELDFWKVAMRPGKPLMFGNLDGMRVIGLPGNPVSSIVCTLLFVRPLIEAMLGRGLQDDSRAAILGADMPANGVRAAYMRATLAHPGDSLPVATPLGVQDSSVLTSMVRADCLLIRDAEAPAAASGQACRVLPLR